MRYLADCHTHTHCSHDSREPLNTMAAAAAQAGLSLLCPTDHLDLLERGAKVMERWDWAPVLEQFEQAKQLCPHGLELRLGIEISSAQFFPQRARQVLAGAPLDMVIGSAHNLSLDAGGLDFIELAYPDEAACRPALDNYFESLLTLASMEEIDVIGHIPYVLRYMNDRDGNRISLRPWREQIREILRHTIARGGGIECNTNRGKTLELWRPILEDYRNLGGEIVTLGSDAHTAQDVGKGIAPAAELLSSLGYRYYSVYRRRKPEFISLDT